MSIGPLTKATLDYRLNHTIGQFESIEREDYDLLRSAFLKYSLQARIGHMDGIFIAYHNTQEIFGFQYLSLPQISELLFGSEYLGLQVFETTMSLLQIVLDRSVQMYPKQRLRVLLSKASGNGLRVLVSPRSMSSPLEAGPPKSFRLSFRQTLNDRELFGFPRLRSPETDAWEVCYNLQETDAPKTLVRKLTAMETSAALVLNNGPYPAEPPTSFFIRQWQKHVLEKMPVD